MSVVSGFGNVTGECILEISGIIVSRFYNSPDSSVLKMTVSGIVPNNTSYKVTVVNGAVEVWAELR